LPREGAKTSTKHIVHVFKNSVVILQEFLPAADGLGFTGFEKMLQ
jgi:hypothetical protein